jgi:hypothetical protein
MSLSDINEVNLLHFTKKEKKKKEKRKKKKEKEKGDILFFITSALHCPIERKL